MKVRDLALLVGNREAPFLALIAILIILSAAVELMLLGFLPVFMKVLNDGNVKVALPNVEIAAGWASLLTISNAPVVLMLIFVAASFLRSAVIWAICEFSARRQAKIGESLLDFYIRKPLLWHGSNKPEELISTSLNEVKRFVDGSLTPYFQILSQGLITSVVFLYLVYYDPMATVYLCSALLTLYIGIALAIKAPLKRLGGEAKKNLALSMKLATQCLTAIRQVKTLCSERLFVDKYGWAIKNSARAEARAHVLAHAPRYAIEAGLLASILFMILMRYDHLTSGSQPNVSVIETLSIFIFAAFRVLPAVSIIQASYSNLTYTREASKRVLDDLRLIRANPSSHNIGDTAQSPERKLSDLDSIEVKNLHFSFNSSDASSVKIRDFKIETRGLHAIVGASGAGKTIAMECLSGLHSAGLSIEEIRLKARGSGSYVRANVESLRNYIYFCPQRFTFFSDTVVGSLVFPRTESIDISTKALELLKGCMGAESFESFIQNNQSFSSESGNGVRCSVGQRQILATVSALLSDRPVIMLDEPNANLDVGSETLLFSALSKFSKSKGIYVVTHRLDNIDIFETVYVFKSGQILRTDTKDAHSKFDSDEYKDILKCN